MSDVNPAYVGSNREFRRWANEYIENVTHSVNKERYSPNYENGFIDGIEAAMKWWDERQGPQPAVTADDDSEFWRDVRNGYSYTAANARSASRRVAR